MLGTLSGGGLQTVCSARFDNDPGMQLHSFHDGSGYRGYHAGSRIVGQCEQNNRPIQDSPDTRHDSVGFDNATILDAFVLLLGSDYMLGRCLERLLAQSIISALLASGHVAHRCALGVAFVKRPLFQ